MSLDISKLENVRTHGGKMTARCAACAEAGHDQTRNHLIIGSDGRFGCVVYPGASPDAREHRKHIFALCGNREIKPLIVRPAGLGRLGRVSEDHSAEPPLKSGLLGRLGRLFQTHSGTELTHAGNKDRTTEKLNDFKPCVPGVLSVLAIEPHRPLSERERVILAEVEAENDPLILEALRIFNGTVAGIEPSDNFRRANFTPPLV
jgi:hypothetical protein